MFSVKKLAMLNVILCTLGKEMFSMGVKVRIKDRINGNPFPVKIVPTPKLLKKMETLFVCHKAV